MKLTLLFLASILLTSVRADYLSRDAVFSMTPEQMVFASKLNDSNRRVYCHKFSVKERQEAIEQWKLKMDDSFEDQALAFTPNDSVRFIEEKISPSEDDFLTDQSRLR
ncbi:MAG: hypothetical protein FJZ57_01640 [Chlamydiae bacterium]|nr:hypothetical protein [Chlamydiota bacterium]